MNTTPARPDPDELLARVRADEARAERGRLKVFLGAAAGVGKTYAMLEAAQARRADGVDVVAGWVQPHGRAETEALLEGLEALAPRRVEHRGIWVDELDLDAALARKPTLILVDELAHSNAPGARHAKRWQDVEELRDAGIDVYTTVNIQHIESLNDVVAQVTGVVVRETVPDALIDQADEVELIDLPPDDLLQRLREGKVYVPERAATATRHFFRKGNLMALREIALRRTADRVDAQMRAYRRDHAIAETWPAAERLLVGVGPGPLASRLVRAARRMAASLHAEWIVLNVETSGQEDDVAERQILAQTLRLAEQLGAEVVTMTGAKVSDELLRFARARNVTKIVIGKPLHSRWHDLLRGSVVEDIVRGSGDIDVYVITGDADEPSTPLVEIPRSHAGRRDYAVAIVVVALCTLVAKAMFGRFDLANIAMVYLFGVVVTATRGRRGPSIVASVLSVAAVDLFFVNPLLTFAVSDTQYLITFAVMLVVGLTISTLTINMRRQAEAARAREHRTAALYALSRDFASRRGEANLIDAALAHIRPAFADAVVVLLPDLDGQLDARAASPSDFILDSNEIGVAGWVLQHGRPAGKGTNTLPGSKHLYLPLIGAERTVGVLGLRLPAHSPWLGIEQLHLLETVANQTALAIERAQLAEEAQHTRVEMETEQLRNALLSSVSHDLRTPLATITGAVSTLLDEDVPPDSPAAKELLQSVYGEASRLNHLVGNLLHMTKLESGTIQVNKDLQSVEEVVGTALARIEAWIGKHPVQTHLPFDLPLVPFDGLLVEQVLINLVENALKYSPPESPIDISAWADDDTVTVEVADRGPGVAAEETETIFEKFYRAKATLASDRGVGLGLAICKAIIGAHGGRIWVAARPGGGAAFRFSLPLGGTGASSGWKTGEAAHDTAD